MHIELLEERRLCAGHVAQIDPAGLTPQQVRHAYGFDQVTLSGSKKPVAADGRGQTIAIVTAFSDPTIAADLRTFDKMFDLPNQTPGGGGFALKVATPQGKPAVDASWAQESSLDVEWAHAMAPGARILLVEARSESAQDLFDAVSFARRRSGVSVVSMSWGWDQAPTGVAFQDILTTPPKHAGKMGKGDGVTFVMSAGDSGTATAWPDASVNVVSVGGTTLTLDSSGNYLSEVPLPQSAQDATVDYNADPDPGYAVYDSIPFQQIQGWQIGSGTSAGAPQWAALIAIADQGRVLQHKHALDGLTQTLPALRSAPASDFHTIVGASPDAGRGSPFADLVIADLVST